MHVLQIEWNGRNLNQNTQTKCVVELSGAQSFIKLLSGEVGRHRSSTPPPLHPPNNYIPPFCPSLTIIHVHPTFKLSLIPTSQQRRKGNRVPNIPPTLC